MRRAAYNQQAFIKAKELMDPEDYETLVQAIAERKPVIFKYTNRFGVFQQYRMEYVSGFLEFPASEIYEGSVNAWSWHELHSKMEQYRVERIKDVKIIITLIEALLDPSGQFVFWDGSMSSIVTTPL